MSCSKSYASSETALTFEGPSAVGGFVNLILTDGMADMNYWNSTAAYSVCQKGGI